LTKQQKFAANLVRLEQEAHRKDFEEWNSAMSFKIFLLEHELGYQITADTNGLALVERLNMLDRYWKEKNKAHKEASSKKPGKSKGKGLIK